MPVFLVVCFAAIVFSARILIFRGHKSSISERTELKVKDVC